ncbi:MAG: hypothetical protein KDN18_09165 [Verrucomicrobiae bacterium]|nr:hypothetical protein [Verrucomicrobiae bacterium]
MNQEDTPEIRPHSSREMREWLGIYREQVLKLPDSGVWRNRPYPHILSAADLAKGLNLLEGIRPAFEAYAESKHIRLHRDFGHLNSSQALAFNLFFPLLPRSESNLPWAAPQRIAETLGFPTLTHAAFERIINQEERTNLDWWGEMEDGGQIFCEVKFTESGFGMASSKATNYGTRRDEIYRPMLEGVIKPGLLDDLLWFRAHYQILRNLAHLAVGPHPDRNRVLFVLPARSPAYGHLNEFLDLHLEPAMSERVIVKGLEAWTEELATSATSEEERKHWREFRRKYCPELPVRLPATLT